MLEIRIYMLWMGLTQSRLLQADYINSMQHKGLDTDKVAQFNS